MRSPAGATANERTQAELTCMTSPTVRTMTAVHSRTTVNRPAADDAAANPTLAAPRQAATRSRAAGTGLGLAIARSYARAHGGDLVYEPATPQGARFQLLLPSA